MSIAYLIYNLEGQHQTVSPWNNDMNTIIYIIDINVSDDSHSHTTFFFNILILHGAYSSPAAIVLRQLWIAGLDLYFSHA